MTKQERTVLCVVIALLLLGAAVKAWRTAHPPKRSSARRATEWVARAAAADGARNSLRSNVLLPC